MTYGLRVKDLSKKYFGDLVSEDRMCIKPKPKKESETVQRILKQYRKNKNKFAVDNL
jgi:hypothetical protein